MQKNSQSLAIAIKKNSNTIKMDFQKGIAYSYRSEKAEIKISKTAGRGLFAKEPIQKGEVVSIRGGNIISRKTESEIEKPENYWGYPISDEFVLAPLTTEEVETVMMFLNHSCVANVGILGQIVFVALRDIAAGEELSIDYAMFADDTSSMLCNCQSKNCRGIITGGDWKKKSIQTQYQGYFSAYIQQKISQNP